MSPHSSINVAKLLYPRYGIPNLTDNAQITLFIEKNPRGTLEDYLNSLEESMADEVRAGAVLCKMGVSLLNGNRNRQSAQDEFETIKKNAMIAPKNRKQLGYGYSLGLEINHAKMDICAKQHIVYAVHTGVWSDIRRQNPEHLFSIISAHPNTVFDVYHMGLPYARESMFLAKNYPNAHLNLVWSHCVSEHIMKSSINELLDTVPLNKVTAFGGDLCTLPEHIYGQPMLTLDNLASAFASRVDEGRMDMDMARHILKCWLYDNPKRIYRL